jgi:hypothetical protein
MSQVLGAFGQLDFTCYGPFSLGARFETYEPYISLIFKFLGGRSKPQIIETVDTGAQLYFLPVQEMESTPGPWYSTIAPVPPLTVKMPATLRIISLGDVQPLSDPVSFTPMTY